MTETEREKALLVRKLSGHPWHRPPHFDVDGLHTYLLTGTCREHRPIIGTSPDRMATFEATLVGDIQPIAWCVLPNHYHAVVRTEQLSEATQLIGKLHGRTSFNWNREDKLRGRRIWYRSADRRIRSSAHFWATLNYVHHNPVRHGYCNRWQDWPYSSATSFLQAIGKAETLETWRNFPIDEYGKGWDPA